jgi:D-alanyl-D-alanine carboxypeptidase
MTFKQEVRLLAMLILALLLVISFADMGWDTKNKPDIDYIAEYRLERDIKRLQRIIDDTTAEGVVVYDASASRVLGEKNVDKAYSLASLTKIITATIVYEKDKNLLYPIREMLRTSDNKDAEKLARMFGSTESLQASYMNAFTKKFDSFYFRNPSGLDMIISTSTGERLPGGIAKPLPLISFIEEYYFKYPELFDQTIIAKDNTNIIVNHLSFLNAGKTGFTDLSGGNLFVSVQKGLDRQIFILVLNSTEKNRFVDVQHIANFLLQSSI